jgi:hypothetical protein
MSPGEFQERVAPLIGKEVSRPWLGIGTALYLEAGPLITVYKSGKPKALCGFDLGSCWRVECADSIAWSSDDPRPLLERHLDQLQSRVIESITTCNRLPELCIQFSGNYWLSTFSTEDQPDWSLFLPNQSYLEVKGGEIRLSTDHRSLSTDH